MRNVLNVSIFSLMLGQDIDTERLKGMLENDATRYNNVYLPLIGETYKMNNCVYFLEYFGSSDNKSKLHIATNHNKYPDVETLQKRDPLIAAIRSQDLNIKFAKIKVPWPQWQKLPALILAKYLYNKNRKQCTA